MSPESAPASSPVLILRKAKDLVAEPVTWTVDQIIPDGMLTVLSGKDKRGKTLLGWEITRAVSRGEPFLGQFSVKQGPVIFLALDDPAVVTVDRLEHLGLTDMPADAPDVHVATPLDGRHTDKTFWDAVESQIKVLRPCLVVVDALYLFLPPGNETMNQAGAMGPLMQRLNQIVERTGTSVLLITHDTKSGGDVAGSFVIRAAAKHILRLGLPSDAPAASQRRILTVESKVTERTDWTLEFNGPGSWKLVDTDAEKLAATKTAVTAWLKQGGTGTVEEIARAVQRRRADVATVLGKPNAECPVKVEKVTSGKGRPRHVYRWIFGPDPGSTDVGPKISTDPEAPQRQELTHA